MALVTPLIDGMNLVAKEYIASTDDGVLVLSEFAGSAKQLKEPIIVSLHGSTEVNRAINRSCSPAIFHTCTVIFNLSHK